jgi:uroporphyrinogen decarboxylase
MANERFQRAIEGKNTSTPPIWFMRQAGRYHSHYQNLRKSYSFEELCKQPELAAEVALGPIQDFDFDVAIMFSDILFPLEALGFGLKYTDAGPKLSFSLTDESFQLLTPWQDSVNFMSFQMKALQATRAVLPKDKSLIGFIGGLWTLYVYAVEGSHAGSLVESKRQPALFTKFLTQLAPLMEKNIEQQIEGGAEVVMIFDTAAGELSPQIFQKWVAPSLLALANKFPGRLGYYSKGTQLKHLNETFLAAPWAGLGFDHRNALPDILKLNLKPFVQGNFDQTLLHLSLSEMKPLLEEYLQPFRDLPKEARANWVCGLGHGVLPKTPQDNVRYFIDRVREVFA